MPVLGLPVSQLSNGARERRSGVLPADPPRAHASGPAPYRVMVAGGSLVAGHGVLTHELGLTGAIARGLSRLTGHGTDVESIVVPSPSSAALARILRRRDLSRFDALVLVLDPVKGLPQVADAARQINRLVEELWKRMVPAASITVAMPQTGSEIDEVVQAAFQTAVRQGAAALTRIVALPGGSDADAAVQRYARWGAAIASTVAAGLVEPMVWSDPVEQLDERARTAEIRRLGALDGEWEALFHRVVGSARRAYGVQSASISVLHAQDAQYLARQGIDREFVPRSQTICDVALRTYGGVIVGDAQADPRFADFPLVRSGHVRFYAGYRVEGPNGQPVAALCVFDPEPRAVRSQDIDLLRDFAILAERTIWERAAMEQRR